MSPAEASPNPFPLPSSDAELKQQCRVETFRSGGKGGQHQNRTDSGVRLVHEPTGVRSTSRSARSQHRNKVIALERLRRKLERRNERASPRIPTNPPEGERRKRLEGKRRRGRLKDLRRRPPPEE